MKHYKYLIVGGGLAGDAAARGVRELDADGSIGMISADVDAPYTRPYLSKALWKGRPLEKVWRGTEALGVDLHLGSKVMRLDVEQKAVQDDQKDVYTYDKLLLATGGSPSHLPYGGDNIIYYRDLQDYRRLRDLSDRKKRFLVIGGGFIGSEIAAALRMNGKEVTMIFPEEAIGARIYPADLARFLNSYYREKGVELFPGELVSGVEQAGDGYRVRTRSGGDLEVDGVVAGIGIRPNTALAETAGLQVDNGIVVDERLQTSAPDIYAAGDVANFQYTLLRKRTRVEHEDNALHMGLLAGRNMAGADERYTYAPMFYSDLFELGFEAVGELSSKLETVVDWQEPYQKGVVYYLDDGCVRGVLLWNVWGKVDEARALIGEGKTYRREELAGRIG